MNIVPFEASHLLLLDLQSGQEYCAPHITVEYAKMLEGEFAFTGIIDGQVVAVAGVTPIWSNRAVVWAFVGKNAGPHFGAIHRAAKQLLALAPYPRIEADTPCEFAAGHKWLRMLGFEMEAERMRGYRPDGGDSSLYARVTL